MSVLSYAKKGYTSELADYCLTLSCPADGLVGKVPGDLLPWLLWFGRILAYVWKNDMGFFPIESEQAIGTMYWLV